MRNATLLTLCLLQLVWAAAAMGQDDAVEEDAVEETAPDAEEAPAEVEPAAETEPEAEDDEPSTSLAQPDLEEDLEAEASEQSEPPAEEEAEEEAAAPAEFPFRNSFFDWTNSVTFNSFWRGSQLSYDPYWYTSFSLTPRWYVAPTSFFWASQSFGLEVTESNSDSYARDPQLTDTLVDFRQIIPWEGFAFQLAARVGLPISKASQAAQRYLQTGLALTITRPIPEIFLTVAASFAYRRWWAGSNVVQSGVPQPGYCPRAAPNAAAPEESMSVYCDSVGIVTTARDIIVTGLTLTFSYDIFSVTGQFLFVPMYAHELAPAPVEVATREEPLVLQDTSRTHWRNFTYFTLAVGLQATPWLSLTLGFQNAGVLAPAYNDDGSVRSIFNPDSQVYLSTTFQLDAIYTELAGTEDDGLTPEERQRRRQGLASRGAGGSF